MNSNKKSRKSTKSKSKPPKKCTDLIDDADDEMFELNPAMELLSFQFRPASIKIRKKRPSAANIISTYGRHFSRIKSVPNIAIADNRCEGYGRSRLTKYPVLLDEEDIEVFDYRELDSEDELLEIWCEESRLDFSNSLSDTEIDVRQGRVVPLRRYVLADIWGDKMWLDEKPQAPYPDSMSLEDERTRPYYDREYQQFKLGEWIFMTHQKSTMVPLGQLGRFFITKCKNRPKDILAQLRLGFRITYTGPCISGSSCLSRCIICEICAHEYHCTCMIQKRYGWCWHMHGAVLNGECKFDGESEVYFTISSRLMQTAHIRGTCYDWRADIEVCDDDATKFVVNDTLWEVNGEKFKYLVQLDRANAVGGRKKSARHDTCPQCKVSRKLYKCSCYDYVNENLCEHCHFVAMYRSGYRASDAQKGDFFYLSDVSDEVDEKEMCSLSLRQRFRVNHQRSYSIHTADIDVYMDKCENRLIYMVSEREERPDARVADTSADTDCSCAQNDAKTCSFCRICRHQYWCQCFESNQTLCKHTHAVQRFSSTKSFNVYSQKRFGDEVSARWSLQPEYLVELRRIRRISLAEKRRRFRSFEIQNLDLTRKGKGDGNSDTESASEDESDSPRERRPRLRKPIGRVAKAGHDNPNSRIASTTDSARITDTSAVTSNSFEQLLAEMKITDEVFKSNTNKENMTDSKIICPVENTEKSNGTPGNTFKQALKVAGPENDIICSASIINDELSMLKMSLIAEALDKEKNAVISNFKNDNEELNVLATMNSGEESIGKISHDTSEEVTTEKDNLCKIGTTNNEFHSETGFDTETTNKFRRGTIFLGATENESTKSNSSKLEMPLATKSADEINDSDRVICPVVIKRVTPKNDLFEQLTVDNENFDLEAEPSAESVVKCETEMIVHNLFQKVCAEINNTSESRNRQAAEFSDQSNDNVEYLKASEEVFHKHDASKEILTENIKKYQLKRRLSEDTAVNECDGTKPRLTSSSNSKKGVLVKNKSASLEEKLLAESISDLGRNDISLEKTKFTEAENDSSEKVISENTERKSTIRPPTKCAKKSNDNSLDIPEESTAKNNDELKLKSLRTSRMEDDYDFARTSEKISSSKDVLESPLAPKISGQIVDEVNFEDALEENELENCESKSEARFFKSSGESIRRATFEEKFSLGNEFDSKFDELISRTENNCEEFAPNNKFVGGCYEEEEIAGPDVTVGAGNESESKCGNSAFASEELLKDGCELPTGSKRELATAEFDTTKAGNRPRPTFEEENTPPPRRQVDVGVGLCPSLVRVKSKFGFADASEAKILIESTEIGSEEETEAAIECDVYDDFSDFSQTAVRPIKVADDELKFEFETAETNTAAGAISASIGPLKIDVCTQTYVADKIDAATQTGDRNFTDEERPQADSLNKWPIAYSGEASSSDELVYEKALENNEDYFLVR